MGVEVSTGRFALSPVMGAVWALLAAWAFYSIRIPLGLLDLQWRLLGSLLATAVVVGGVVLLLESLHPSPFKHWLGAAAWRDQFPAAPAAVRACCVGLAIYPVASGVRTLTEQILPTAPAALRARAEFLEANSASLLIVTVVVLGPMLEELLYRGALWDRLGTAGVLPSFVVCTLGFALAHGEPAEWPALVLVAACLGILRHCSGRWADCWLAHASFNAVTVGSVIVNGGAAELPEFSPAQFVTGLFLTSALVVACWRRKEPTR